MAAMINLYDIKFNNAMEIASTGLCFGLVFLMPIGLMITFYAIYKFRKLKIIGSDDYQDKFSELTMERDESEI
jgi:Na+/glutamate symporter